tara:strand:- start:442 stop:1008 length:567 start_codon:yes stop_codon:yes gene_type:complete
MIKTFNYKCVESTNTTAMTLIKSGEQSPGLVIAQTQTAGKGQYDRTWYSQSQDGLYMSYFQPFIEIKKLEFQFSLANTFLSNLADCIDNITNIHCQCRFPNDIYLNDKKIAGILTELVSFNEQRYIIVGIGLNINQAEFPQDLSAKATSLYLETNQQYYKPQFELKISQAIQQVCNDFCYKLQVVTMV